MIPKVIHYCWFGHNPLPPLARKCIASWRKFLPDYEIKEWNESNFDVNSIPYTRDAYKAKKYAFVSDYARFKILYEYGGLYFDTDVEIIRPLGDIIERGAFMGIESSGSDNHIPTVNPGLGIGAIAGMAIYRDLLDIYEKGTFSLDNMTTIVQYTTALLEQYGLRASRGIQQCADIWIYPREYFCPLFGRHIHFTKNTRTIHHYMSSWKKYGIRKKCVMIVHKLIIFYHKTININF